MTWNYKDDGNQTENRKVLALQPFVFHQDFAAGRKYEHKQTSPRLQWQS